MTTFRPLVILGSGYTGRWIYQLARQRSLPVYASSRKPELHLTYAESKARLRFDLADPETWSALPLNVDLIWAFPAVPLERVQAFAARFLIPSARLVVLGSTSAYDRVPPKASGTAPWIDETGPVNTALPRVQGEEYLRTHHGATLLRVAGIYGPHRNPVEWIRQGRVGPTEKFVNLIHVEDLAQLCLLALNGRHAGETYNVSDGQPRRWADICTEVARRWGIVSPLQADSREPGKRILNQKLLDHFAPTFQHPDLYAALQVLQSPLVSPIGEIAAGDGTS
jgi:nucleoside-diphosphate-sugar epimerase